jgi:hypothetical protein
MDTESAPSTIPPAEEPEMSRRRTIPRNVAPVGIERSPTRVSARPGWTDYADTLESEEDESDDALDAPPGISAVTLESELEAEGAEMPDEGDDPFAEQAGEEADEQAGEE